MKTEKTYTIKKTRKNGKESIKTGTLEELTSYFSYTLEVGNSYNNKISLKPIKSLVSNLEKSYDEVESGSYNRTFIVLIENESEV